SSAYATAGSGGVPLSGGSVYIAPDPVAEYTLTISKTRTADFTTIQSAIDSAVRFDPNVHYTFQILDSSVYHELNDLSVPATSVCVGSARPILAVQANLNGYDKDGAGTLTVPHPTDWEGNPGLLINLPNESITTCAMMLKNLIIIPSRTGPAPV